MDSDFTREAYSRHLCVARECGYEFVLLESLLSTRTVPQRVVAIRHDVDYSLSHARILALAEREQDVVSTYCVFDRSPYYSIGSKESIEAVEKILGLGHGLGLHFDATEVKSDDEVVEMVTAAAEGLERLFGVEVRVVSFHMPGRRPVGQIELSGGRINTYSPPFFDEVKYVSDSNQNWRGVDLEALLRSQEHHKLQLLIHPIWWQSCHGTMLERLRVIARDLCVPLSELLTVEQLQLLTRDEADKVIKG